MFICVVYWCLTLAHQIVLSTMFINVFITLKKHLITPAHTLELMLIYSHFIFTLNYLRLLKEVLLVSTVMSSDLAGKCCFFSSRVTSFICCKWLSCLLMNCCLVCSAAALSFASWFSPPAVMLERVPGRICHPPLFDASLPSLITLLPWPLFLMMSALKWLF